jgi:hypothetical protein
MCAKGGVRYIRLNCSTLAARTSVTLVFTASRNRFMTGSCVGQAGSRNGEERAVGSSLTWYSTGTVLYQPWRPVSSCRISMASMVSLVTWGSVDTVPAHLLTGFPFVDSEESTKDVRLLGTVRKMDLVGL